MTGTDRRRYRGLLRSTVVSSAAPYGYTLTLWMTGVAATQVQGRGPTTADALLLALGAVLAFTAVGAAALGGPGAAMEPGPGERVRLWGATHLMALPANLGISWLVLREIHGHVVWAVLGFTATAGYLLAVAGQYWCASLRRERRDGDPPSERPLRRPSPPRHQSHDGFHEAGGAPTVDST